MPQLSFQVMVPHFLSQNEKSDSGLDNLVRTRLEGKNSGQKKRVLEVTLIFISHSKASKEEIRLNNPISEI